MDLMTSKYYAQQKISGSVKKWKVPGIKSITTVKHQIKKKNGSKDHGGFLTTKYSTFDW